MAIKPMMGDMDRLWKTQPTSSVIPSRADGQLGHASDCSVKGGRAERRASVVGRQTHRAPFSPVGVAFYRLSNREQTLRTKAKPLTGMLVFAFPTQCLRW